LAAVYLINITPTKSIELHNPVWSALWCSTLLRTLESF